MSFSRVFSSKMTRFILTTGGIFAQAAVLTAISPKREKQELVSDESKKQEPKQIEPAKEDKPARFSFSPKGR